MSNWVQTKQPCPVCPSSDAYHIHADGHGYCFSCQYFKPSKDSFVDTEFTYEYLPYRGLTKDTLRTYDMKTKIDKDGKPISVGYVMPNGDIKVRNLAEKSFYWTKGSDQKKAGLFGMDKFEPGKWKYITITEGYEDAASIHQVTEGPAVSVHSSTSAVNDCIHDRDKLNSYERIYLAFDSDGPGREATERVAQLFDPSKVFVVKFNRRKDANEYLQHGEGDELKRIWWNSKLYLPEKVVNSFEDIGKLLSVEPKRGIPAYPTAELNKMTYGIRTGETVLIVAQEKVGKTEVMHDIEYSLLQQTDWPIAAIYLEEPAQRHAQAIAGLHIEKPVHLPDCGVGQAQVFDAFKEAVKEDGRLFIYSHFGSDDPDVFIDLVRFLVTARGVRAVLFDHLTMVVSGHQGEDERRVLDYLSTKLEMLVKELDFALIMVSHVNDEGKTRGSRYLTKVADITIGLERDLQNLDPMVRRTTNLRVLYNRFSGETGPAGQVIYIPEKGILEDLNEQDELFPLHANDNNQSQEVPHRHGAKGLEVLKEVA